MRGQVLRGSGFPRTQIRKPFGVYRPLTAESAFDIGEALFYAHDDINTYLERKVKGAPGFWSKPVLGVTIVPRKFVAQDLEFGPLGRSYDPEHGAKLFESMQVDDGKELEIPLGEVGWFAPNERRLGLFLSQGKERGQLNRQVGRISLWLREAAGGEKPRVAVRHPNHLTLGWHGHPDGPTPRPLPNRNMHRIGNILMGHLKDGGVDSITLGPVVVGDDYDKPHPEYVALGNLPVA